MPEIESQLMRIYCLATDWAGEKRLHEAIVAQAHDKGLAGASVQRAIMGFSQNGHFYSDLLSSVEMAEQPLLVEIVDSPKKIETFLPALHELVQGRRLITLERAQVKYYKAEEK